MIHVDTYLGACDIQIKEITSGQVRGVMRTEAKHGSATTLTTEREDESPHQEYRTRIVVTAKNKLISTGRKHAPQ